MPDLTVNGHALPLNAVSCITHITKLLGHLDKWKAKLKVAHKAGYNMIHFTPVQKLGISNSRCRHALYHLIA
ncbi:unnamed protein product [Gongylonema pulchrum]|uniref:HDGE_amylase domain-containing protein n=1 Tax=Gongylonema pulchrum TaxID=637853 RepID=A0A183EZB8_9BILA|nr:unnamed protein product [Gongylonema pulchrum]